MPMMKEKVNFIEKMPEVSHTYRHRLNTII